MQRRPSRMTIIRATLLSIVATLSLNACGDVSKAPAPVPAPAAPGPLAILTSDPLPAGTVGVSYDVTLAPNGGTAPYTWGLAAGSPALPNGLAFTPADGKILGKPTSATGTILTDFTLQDAKGQSVHKVLSITVNVAPTPLSILTSSLPSGSIGQGYASALGGTGGTTPYTWGLKNGSPPLPNGLTLSASTGAITGIPMVTSNATQIFTLTDATSLTIEKSLAVTISAVPLSITTNSLPPGTQSQNYAATLAAAGGTPPLTWSPIVTPPLPSGLVFDAATATVSGVPTVISSQTHTFSITDSTLPTNQTATKGLQLTIGALAPLTIPTASLPSGTVTQNYSSSVTASGGVPPYTWSIVGGSTPAPGLTLTPSGTTAGAITGIPSTNMGSPFTRTYQVQDSGVPQQTKTKDLTISIGLPTSLTISTTTLPDGVLNQPYSQTVQASGGSGTRIWSFQGGNIPNLTIASSTGVISGNPTPTGNSFTFTVQVTDALFTATKQFTIAVTAPPKPKITTSSLPIGTVGIPYSAQLQATDGAPPLNFQPVGLPFGLTFNVSPNSSTATITGMPTSNGSQSVTFTVNDSTVPFNQTGTIALPLTVSSALIIDTLSPLPPGCTNKSYSTPLVASGGTPPYTWTTTANPALPAGLSIIQQAGSDTATISGTPTAADNQSHTFTVHDAVPTIKTKPLTLNIKGTLTITTPSPLTSGQHSIPYGPVTLTACGGTPPYTWSTTVTPALPAGLSLSAAGVLSGTPTATETNVSHTFTVNDSMFLQATAVLSLTIQ